MHPNRKDIIAKLQKDLLCLQGFKSLSSHQPIKFAPVTDAFPNRLFPTGAIHEFIISKAENAAATCGFIMAILAQIMAGTGAMLWISAERSLFPPALNSFGIDADKIIFIDLHKEWDRFWAMEEALKCEGLSAVVCENPNLSFTASRRFQLAVEQSGVTGFIVRNAPRSLAVTASIARWKITSLNSQSQDLPGVGFPRWNVELLKVRNGKTGTWKIEFAEQQLNHIPDVPVIEEQQKKAG